MKNVFFLLAFAMLISLFTNCTKAADPIACATVPTTGKAGVSLTFVSCSTNAHHEEWDFGDAATTTGTTVTHAYNKAGTYTVTLTALIEDKSKSNVIKKTITIMQ